MRRSILAGLSAAALLTSSGTAAHAGTAPDFCADGFTARTHQGEVRAGTGSEFSTDALPAGTTVRVYAYTQPSTDYVKVREAALTDGGQYVTTVRPPRNTRLYAEAAHPDCPEPVRAPSTVLEVSPAITIAAVRHAPRDYTFHGRYMPASRAGKIVSLYYWSNGRRILAAQTRVREDGTWRIDRRFLGSGEFPFFLLSGADMQNVGGRSRDRHTVVH